MNNDPLAQFVVAGRYCALFGGALKNMPEEGKDEAALMFAGLLAVVYVAACEVVRKTALGKDPQSQRKNDWETVKKEAKDNQFWNAFKRQMGEHNDDLQNSYRSLVSLRNAFVHQGRASYSATYQEVKKYCADAYKLMRMFCAAAHGKGE